MASLLISLGDLIPQHVKVFRESSYFKDTSIPCPDKRVSPALTRINVQKLLLLMNIFFIGTFVSKVSPLHKTMLIISRGNLWILP